jgi:hypothetical protein
MNTVPRRWTLSSGLMTSIQALKVKRAMSAGRAAARRIAHRDALWPDAADVAFRRTRGGWTQMPRTVPMIASLIDQLGGKNKAGRLYIALWSYDYGDGFVEVRDPVLMAGEAGYVTGRAERTFAERMRELEELGFIRTAEIGAREFGFALLLDPHIAVAKLRQRRPAAVPAKWWSAFVARCTSIGLGIPEVEGAALELAADSGSSEASAAR